ncbi:hypothetical protein J8Z24_19170 [Pseudoalteromonas sp. SCSIO 43201]|uniref:tetratricopeptide repeat protein n=1 Tax=Pseudoalteromonas sp. SCSIO 43201 TaxID=2822842 RepID=UPI00207521B4|nr:TRAP transporter TatT component family protein [Pseudoalteromonas sp. SCSIO 43201]USD30258.1 hypothetical protein J8Z24_19170 [Pseudoalteromonas sp. SCSIO 43201]
MYIHAILLFMLFAHSTLTHANLELSQQAFDEGNLHLAQSLLIEQPASSYKKPLLLAHIAMRRDDYKAARQQIEEALNLYPTVPELYFAHSQVVAKIAEQASIFSVARHIKSLKQSLIKAVELAPEHSDYRSALIKFYINAPSMFGGDKQEAKRHIEKLEKTDAFSALLTRLWLYARLDEQAKFTYELEQGVQQYPLEPALYHTLGALYYELDKPQLALSYLRQATEIKAQTKTQQKYKALSLVLIGTVSLQLEAHYDEGQKALEQYLNNMTPSHDMPDKSQVKFKLATIAIQQNNGEIARQWLQAVIRETPSNKLKREAKSALKKLTRS